MSIKQKAIKGIIWSGIQNWGSQAGSLVVFLVLARILSPADFGLVALANTFLAFFGVFIDQGFAVAIIQRQEIEEKHLNTAFWTQICLGIIFTLLGIIASDSIAQIFKQPQLIPILKWFSLLFFINSLNLVQRAILRRNLAFKKIAIRSLSGIILSGIVGIIFALSGLGVWSLVAQQLTFEIVGVIVFWNLSDWKPKLQFSLPHFKELFNFGISIFGSKFLTFFNQHTDDLLIGYFLGEVALGYYAVAYRVLRVLIQLLVNTGNQVTLPLLARLQTEPEKFLRIFYQATKFTSVIALPVFLGVVTMANELVVTIFGIKWLPSIPLMRILAFGGIFYVILFFNRSVFVSMGKPLWRLRIELLNVILNIIACLIAIRYGILAVAFAYVISDFLVVPVSLWSLNQLINVSLKDYLSQLTSSIICATIMMILIWLVKYWLEATFFLPQTILIICTFSGAIFYLLSLRLFAPLLFQELHSLVRMGLSSSQKGKG